MDNLKNIFESQKAILFPGEKVTQELQDKLLWIAEQIVNCGNYFSQEQAIQQAANYCKGDLHIYPAIGVSAKDRQKVFELQNNLKYPALGEISRLYGKYSSITAYISDYTTKDEPCIYNLAPTEVQRLYEKIKYANYHNTTLEEKLIKVYDSVEKTGKYKGKSKGAFFTLKRSLVGRDGKEAQNKWSVQIARAYGLKSSNGNYWTGKPDIELQLIKFMDDNMIDAIFREACEIIEIYLASPYIVNMLRLETTLIQASKEMCRKRHIENNGAQESDNAKKGDAADEGIPRNNPEPQDNRKSMMVIMDSLIKDVANDLKVITVTVAQGPNKGKKLDLYLPIYRYEYSKEKISRAIGNGASTDISYEIVNDKGKKYCYFVE